MRNRIISIPPVSFTNAPDLSLPPITIVSIQKTIDEFKAQHPDPESVFVEGVRIVDSPFMPEGVSALVAEREIAFIFPDGIRVMQRTDRYFTHHLPRGGIIESHD